MDIKDNSFFFEGGPNGVLLLHGLTGTPAEMKYVGKGLARAGFTVYGMQLAGHCGSKEDLLATGWRDWCTSAEQGMAFLAGRCARVFAAGLSMGALLALWLAARHPETVAGIGLYSTSLRHDGRSVSRFNAFLPLLMLFPQGRRHCFPESFPYGIKNERLRDRIVAMMYSGDSSQAGLIGTPGASLMELWRLRKLVMKEMPGIRTPSLIMHASKDDVTSLWNVHYLQKHLAGPIETVLLDDCFHMITVDQQCDAVVAHTARFFQALGVAEPSLTCSEAALRDCAPATEPTHPTTEQAPS
ncbi:MAG: alpha/beta hydrolase [Solidesulfovibrio sp.]